MSSKVRSSITPPLPSICHFLATPWKEVTKLQKEMKKYRVLRLFSGETIVSNKLYVLKTLFYSSSHIRVWQIFKWFCLQRQGLRVENILRCRFFPTHTISKGCSGAEKEIRSKIDFFCSFLVRTIVRVSLIIPYFLGFWAHVTEYQNIKKDIIYALISL